MIHNKDIKDIADLGAYTRDARYISAKSRSIAENIVGNETPEDKIRQRVVIATGDPAFKDLLAFKNDPITHGIDAIERGRDIYTDIRMVQVGITNKGHDCTIRSFIEFEPEEDQSLTRTASGAFTLGEALNDSIVVIGNAPSATIALCKLIKSGITPALVIATPVGFVNAAESKELLRQFDIPSITSIGTRGGTPVAVAAMNELIKITNERLPR
ncbi:Precorrin-8X methylmutase [Candidatus Methanoperedenaceae archaeon GB50]|nr:Precorrin-8X methylmutase [Candidatus Methanoperedenaceae archaeon GB50]